MIESKHFTTNPAGINSTVLLEDYNKLLIQNLVGYLNSIQSSLNLDISFLITKIHGLDPKKKYSPAIYNLLAKLSQSSTRGNIQEIIDAVHQLSIITEGEILDSNFRLSTILSEQWEPDFVAKIRSEHIPGRSNETIILPIINPNLFPFSKIVFDFKEQIKKIDIDFYGELNNYVTRLKLFNGKGLKAATSASVFGAIYLNLPHSNDNAEAYFAEHIVHETSHLHLDILLAFDQIVLNEDNQRFPSPLRVDLRPMFGIFHATFVLSRMVRIFQKMVNERPNIDFTNRLELFRKQFEQGLETVEKHAVLTENGKRIKASLTTAAEIISL